MAPWEVLHIMTREGGGGLATARVQISSLIMNFPKQSGCYLNAKLQERLPRGQLATGNAGSLLVPVCLWKGNPTPSLSPSRDTIMRNMITGLVRAVRPGATAVHINQKRRENNAKLPVSVKCCPQEINEQMTASRSSLSAKLPEYLWHALGP